MSQSNEALYNISLPQKDCNSIPYFECEERMNVENINSSSPTPSEWWWADFSDCNNQCDIDYSCSIAEMEREILGRTELDFQLNADPSYNMA
jgi:hypothetical protein